MPRYLLCSSYRCRRCPLPTGRAVWVEKEAVGTKGAGIPISQRRASCMILADVISTYRTAIAVPIVSRRLVEAAIVLGDPIGLQSPVGLSSMCTAFHATKWVCPLATVPPCHLEPPVAPVADAWVNGVRRTSPIVSYLSQPLLLWRERRWAFVAGAAFGGVECLPTQVGPLGQ